VKTALALSLLISATAGAACGPARVVLPAGPGTVRADYAPIFEAATAGCRGVRTLTADLGLSGRSGQQKVRGHVLSGFAPGALRLEGLAPFGGPVFILVAESGRGTLLLTRDHRVLGPAPPADILRALVGVSLPPDDLLAVLTGCVSAAPAPVGARAFGPDWLAVDLAGGGVAYLNRRNAEWLLVAGRSNGLEIQYGNRLGGLPQSVRIRSADSNNSPAVDLDVRLQSFEINPALGREAFSVVIPPGTSPITLDELRRSGPLGQ
jgi:hypothetical protein